MMAQIIRKIRSFALSTSRNGFCTGMETLLSHPDISIFFASLSDV